MIPLDSIMDSKRRLQYSLKIEQNEPINIDFKFADSETLMLINSLTAKYLAKMDNIYLLNSIGTILREIVVNAMKANAKRVFFKKNEICIDDPDSYAKGMNRFKNEVIGEFKIIENDLKQSDYYVKIGFSRDAQGLNILVKNNSIILPQELDRINLRVDKAIQMKDFTEAYEEIEDDTEGAGLGIVLTILFLKNMGIDPRSFKITSTSSDTEVYLNIPVELRSTTVTSKIKDEIVKDVEGIPTFPDSIIRLQNLCRAPESTMEMISDEIMRDPSMSADVIKLANSAGFVPGKRIETVLEAVKNIGLKNVDALLVATAARTILESRYQNFEEIWNHLAKTAFYARILGHMLKKQGLSDSAFMGGLLHDLGKIVLLSTHMEAVKKIADTVKNRKIVTSTVMEEISIGISHSEIGKLIAEKWNFPDYLIEAIRYHHAPQTASPEFRDLTFTVYLANMLCGLDDRRYYFDYIDEAVLERFNILDPAKFQELHKALRAKWEQT